jgi:DNA-binding transcriptional MerR regulator
MRRSERWRSREDRATAARARPPGASNAAGARAYTVDELAYVARVPSRTIRFYQFQGVLPRPARHGRVALYDDRHVERLRLVSELQDRGLSLRAVRHLLHQDSGDARLLRSCLGLEKPWSDDRARTVSYDELEQLVGERPPGTIASLLTFDVVRPEHGDAASGYWIPSPGLLRTTLALQESGVTVETAVRAGDILRRHLGTAARELVAHFTKRAGRGFGRSTAPNEIGTALNGLRPLAGEAARLIFAREIERALRERSEPSRPRRSSHKSRRKRRAR